MGLIDWFKPKEQKAVPESRELEGETREGLDKAYMPEWIYRPPYGYPRYVDLTELRRLAKTPFVDMCITTIVDELTAIPWDIVYTQDEEPSSEKQAQIDHVKEFFNRPNSNYESFENILKKVTRDILEVEAGIINKIFNQKGEMVEIMAKDGATFTKNPDPFGKYDDREDLILDDPVGAFYGNNPPNPDAKTRGAYFQYGWLAGSKPVAFGRKEVVWIERNPRTYSIYSRSPVEVLRDTVKTLIYSIEANLEYYNDNSIPKGIIGLEDSDSQQIRDFKEQWKDVQKKKDSFGGWKKMFYHLPILNKTPKFERIQFSNLELDMINQQQWFSKIVWAVFGVTPSELGFTENSNRATEIIQSSVFRRKAINPLIRLIEYYINQEIVSEFEYDDIKFKFQTFEIDEQMKKAELYEKEVKTYKTVNEVRKEEGLEEIDGYDKLIEGNKDEDQQNQQNQQTEDKGIFKSIKEEKQKRGLK